MKDILGIIPARYASTRFPGKPLVTLGKMSMIERVYRAISDVLEHVLIATDDKRIQDHVESFGGEVVMTSEKHRSGTDRCAEAMEIYAGSRLTNFNIVLNVQGDEPFIRDDQIRSICECFTDKTVEIATLIKPIDDSRVIFDPNRPKVVVDAKDFAMYFSRSPIPFVRDLPADKWMNSHRFFQHIGMYAYRKDILQKLSMLKPGILERVESLEQLRWLEHGFRIKTAVTQYESFGIDTPADLENAKKLGLFE
jgi:3-deoxy-manno-octulosonate cytidylyltransferase (CMP-KDO synthetase)